MKTSVTNFTKQFSSNKALVLFAALICTGIAAHTGLAAEEFSYKHFEGDKYRILSTVSEDVYINRRMSHRAEISNRIAVEVTGVEAGKGTHKATFSTAEQSIGLGTGTDFKWAEVYDSEYVRDEAGTITIDPKYFMPVVRNVPVFPTRDVKIGETWSSAGHEMHDFRNSFGIEQPYQIPFTANYQFLGKRKWKGTEYSTFSVSYRIFSEPQAVSGSIFPVRIMGASDQLVYWDAQIGQAKAYEESFRMIFELSSGQTVEYRGRAEAELIESQRMDRKKVAEEVAKDLGRLAIRDVTVRESDEGVVLNLENIQFYPDSDTMLPGQQDKLNKIAEILLRYQDRDILVAGHSALAGNEGGRQKLSQDRAAAVANYLITQKVRSPDRVVVRGYGATRPVAPNDTEANRARNRRVEITILEN
ncbi:OmpA family protein [Breznakiellaceae bacterium SP9]